MNYNQAKKLRNGDEVIDKNTNESVKVLSIKEEIGRNIVIEGIGDKQGYNHWYHRAVK